MKICVSSYSFSKLMAKGELNQFSAIAKAKELGFDGIEFAGIAPHDGTSKEEYAHKLRAEADRLGVPVASFVFGADLINGTEGRTPEQEVEYVKSMVDIGQILGVPVIRHDVLYSLGEYSDFYALLRVLSDRVRRVTEYAAGKGIRTSVENHGFICQDPDRCVALYKAVDHPNFGLLCDIGNFLCADAEPAASVAMVAPYAIFAHAKDFYVRNGDDTDPGRGFFKSRGGNYLKGTIIGHGNVPVVQCLQILKDAGYEGFLSLEFEGMEDTIDALRVGLENLQRYISALN